MSKRDSYQTKKSLKNDIGSLNVDWFNKNTINLTGNKRGLGFDLGHTLLIRPLVSVRPMNHEIFTKDTKFVLDDNPPDDSESALHGLFFDMRLDDDV